MDYPVVPRCHTLFPYPKRAPHPDFFSVLKELEEWAADIVSKSLPDPFIDYLKKSGMCWDSSFVYFVAITYDPTCSREVFKSICKYMVMGFNFWFYMFTYREKLDLLEEIRQEVIAITSKGWTFDKTSTHKRHFLLNMHADAFQSMIDAGLSEDHKKRIQGEAKIFFDEFKKTLEWGKKPWPLNSYLEHRRANVFGTTYFVTAEFSAGLSLPPEVYNHPDVVDLYLTASDILNITDDLQSFLLRSALDDHYDTYLTSLMGETGCDAQEAVNKTIHLLFELNQKFVNDTKKLSNSPLAVEYPQLDKLLKYIYPKMVYGNMQWCDLNAISRLDMTLHLENVIPDMLTDLIKKEKFANQTVEEAKDKSYAFPEEINLSSFNVEII